MIFLNQSRVAAVEINTSDRCMTYIFKVWLLRLSFVYKFSHKTKLVACGETQGILETHTNKLFRGICQKHTLFYLMVA